MSITRTLRYGVASLAFAGLVFASVHGQEAPGQAKNPYKGLSLAELGAIEVTTQSKQPEQVWKTAAAIAVLTQEDIRRSGVTNIPDALRLLPGVEVARVSGNRNWAVGIRGFGDQFSKSVLVLIDGRSVYTPLFAGAFWTLNHVMLEDVERIEVIRGPGGTIWGANAVNGIINIITKDSKDTQGALVSMGGGSTDQGTGDFRYGGGNGSGLTYRVYGSGFIRGPQFHPDNVNYDDSRLGTVGMRSDWVRGRDKFTLLGDVYRADLGDAQSISSFAPLANVISYQSTEAAGGNVLGRWERKLNATSDFFLQTYWERTWRLGPNFGETRDTFDVDFLHKFGWGSRNAVSYGAGAHVSPGTIKEIVPTITFTPLKKTNRVFSLFLQDEFTVIPDRLVLTVGSKLEHNDYTGFEYQPSGRLLYTPNKTNSFWLAATRAVRTPSRVDADIKVDVLASSAPVLFAELIGNPNIRAERLVSYEAGYRALPHAKLFFDVSTFVNFYNDIVAQGDFLVTFESTPTPPHLLFTVPFVNGVRGRTAGVEVAPNWRPVAWWEAKGSYSYLHMDMDNKAFLKRTVTRDLIEGSSPRHQVVLQSRFNLPKRFEFDQTYRYVSALRAQVVPAYHTADVRLGWNPHRQLELSLVGQNLLQPHHAEFGIDPPPTVSIKRGIYAKFVWRSRE
jgi:iron complex outermembrane recepter protein